jgi:hypothetical protein
VKKIADAVTQQAPQQPPGKGNFWDNAPIVSKPQAQGSGNFWDEAPIVSMIKVKAPDGSIVQFPAGTNDTTIESVMRDNYGGPATTPPVASPASSRSWADVPGEALRNIPSSAAHVASGVLNTVLHPAQTVSTLNDAIEGAFNKVPLPQWLKDAGCAELHQSAFHSVFPAASSAHSRGPGSVG